MTNVTLSLPEAPDVGLEVRTFELEDRMSDLFELTLVTQTTDVNLSPRAVIGRRAVVAFGEEDLLPRVEGIVRRIQQISAEATGVSRYVLNVVPPLWLLTQRVDHRIFQGASVPEIVAAVLAGYGGRVAPPVSRLGRVYPKLDYCAQYGETDLDFVFRLLADEGIATFFDHARGGAWVLVDDTTLFAPALEAPVPYIEDSALGAKGPHITSAVITSAMGTSAITLRDYDYENPRFTLEGRATPGGAELFLNEGDLEAYGYEVGKVTSTAEANERAQRQLDAARAPGRVFTLGASFALGAGTRLHLGGHPRSDANADLLVVRSSTAGRELDSTHVMECTDAARPFRPARRPKPRVAGTQTAFVVGERGEEIDVDALGRVLVELRWDRRGLGSRTSRRVRVSQGWAGPGYGLVSLPRVGDEVVVEYLDGDPDQPLIVGRVHNAVSLAPLNLPQEKTVSIWRTRSSPGGDGHNELRMDDAAGAELVALRAQRDFRQEVVRDSSVRVGSGQTTSVGGNAAAWVGGDQSLKVAGTYSVSAGSAIQFTTDAFSVSAKSSIHLTTPGERLDESANHIVKANAVYVQAREVCQVTGATFHVFCDHIVLQAGGSKIELTPGGITIESAGVVDIKGSLIKLNSP